MTNRKSRITIVAFGYFIIPSAKSTKKESLPSEGEYLKN